MADIGIKFSKKGFSVLTAADKDLIFSSKFDTFRVFAFGQGQYTHTFGTPTTITLNHGQNYRMAFDVYATIIDSPFNGKFAQLPYTFPIGGDASFMPYCDDNNLRIRFGAHIAPSSTVISYRYFIYYNQAK